MCSGYRTSTPKATARPTQLGPVGISSPYFFCLREPFLASTVPFHFKRFPYLASFLPWCPFSQHQHISHNTLIVFQVGPHSWHHASAGGTEWCPMAPGSSFPYQNDISNTCHPRWVSFHYWLACSTTIRSSYSPTRNRTERQPESCECDKKLFKGFVCLPPVCLLVETILIPPIWRNPDKTRPEAFRREG